MNKPDFRATVDARAKALRVQRAELGRRVASAWGVPPETAEETIAHWLAGRRGLQSDRLADLFWALGLTVEPTDVA